MKPTNSFQRILFVFALAGPAAITVSRSAAQDAKPTTAQPSSSATQPAAKPDGDYVGEEVCVTCHADQQKSFVHTIMGNAMAHPKTELEKLGCEGCHGPGKAHVEAGGGKDTIPVRFTKDSNTPVEERNAACLSCHTKGNQMFWRGSPHESRAMACVDCPERRYRDARVLCWVRPVRFIHTFLWAIPALPDTCSWGPTSSLTGLIISRRPSSTISRALDRLVLVFCRMNIWPDGSNLSYYKAGHIEEEEDGKRKNQFVSSCDVCHAGSWRGSLEHLRCG
jgi:cytochrome c554/c'-like protein